MLGANRSGSGWMYPQHAPSEFGSIQRPLELGVQQQQRTPSVLTQDAARADTSITGRKTGQTRGNAYAAESFAVRDPLDRVDLAGGALSEPGQLDISTGSFDGPETSPPEAGAMDHQARVLATEAHPVYALRPSSEAELVQLSAPDVVVPGSQRVTKRYGSLASPFAYEELVLDPLFIGGGPHMEDVQQGGLGSCYLLADLLSVVSQDPAHIERMISVKGGVAVVLFHRYDEQAGKWIPVSVAVNTGLARDAKNPGTLLGSGFRVAKEPVSAAWYAELNPGVDGGELVIARRSVHEAAMWAPLLEKAYARFSEMYGQCGGHPRFTREEKGGGSGYDAMEGGWASATMRVLYGEGVVDRQLEMIDGATEQLLSRSEKQIVALLRVAQDASRTTMTASAGSIKLTERLGKILTRVLATPGDVAPDTLDFCRKALHAANMVTAPSEVETIVPFARTLVNSTPAESSGDLGQARDVCSILMNHGITNADSRRSIYADHAYSVAGADLRSSAGKALDLRPQDVAGRVGEIDGSQSTVELRNPHRFNEPDMEGNGPADGQDDGRFDMPLLRFLTMFTQLDIGALQ